jgi:hypothetical protein
MQLRRKLLIRLLHGSRGRMSHTHTRCNISPPPPLLLKSQHTDTKIVQGPLQTNTSPRSPSVRIEPESTAGHHEFAEYHSSGAGADVERVVACAADERYAAGGGADGECLVADNTSCMS